MSESTIVPYISSSVAGPLGIMHLPRLWLKILLHARGRLPAGYRHGEGGFDQRLCEHFGLDRAAFITFIESEQPDYPRVEAWVREHATTLEAADIATFNAHVMDATFSPERAAEARARFGITDAEFPRAVGLNDLDDWALLHASLIADRAATP